MTKRGISGLRLLPNDKKMTKKKKKTHKQKMIVKELALTTKAKYRKSNAGRNEVDIDAYYGRLKPYLLQGFTLEQSCKYARVPHSTIISYMTVDTELKANIECDIDSVSMQAQSTVVNAIGKGDINVSKWWLERKKKEDFNTQQKIESSPLSVAVTNNTLNIGGKSSKNVVNSILQGLGDGTSNNMDQIKEMIRLKKEQLNNNE